MAHEPTVCEVRVDPPYRVTIGAGLLEGAGEVFPGERPEALLADARVFELHGARLGRLTKLPRLTLPGGESAKTFARLEEVIGFMAAHGLDRRSLLYTLGGGTLLDLGGLAASLFKRGMGVLHLPTTLLAQVDASVGGKTAINLDAGKNLVGTFHQPQAVLADTGVLSTVEDDDWRSGLGECAKTAMIAGEDAFARLEALAPALVAREPDAVHEAVAACVETKAQIVARDPTEHGPRRLLNLGHTFAHGIEHASGFEVPHGVAVAVGLRLAVQASAAIGKLTDGDLDARLTCLLDALGLPAGMSALAPLQRHGAAVAERVLAGMAHDKKGAVGAPRLVLPRRLGENVFGVPVEPDALLDILRAAQ